jgi:hypothetical protein
MSADWEEIDSLDHELAAAKQAKPNFARIRALETTSSCLRTNYAAVRRTEMERRFASRTFPLSSLSPRCRWIHLQREDQPGVHDNG